MNDEAADRHQLATDERRRAEKRYRSRVVIVCSVTVAAIDTLLSCLLIPWIDRQDWAMTRYGSVGYVVYFVMVFFTFIAFLAMTAYYFSSSSYPSDEWR